jgi:hypothetical protein
MVQNYRYLEYVKKYFSSSCVKFEYNMVLLVWKPSLTIDEIVINVTSVQLLI